MVNMQFTVIFDDYGKDDEEHKCDFCEVQPIRYYCDFLVEGYCQGCMDLQEKEYLKENKLKENG